MHKNNCVTITDQYEAEEATWGIRQSEHLPDGHLIAEEASVWSIHRTRISCRIVPCQMARFIPNERASRVVTSVSLSNIRTSTAHSFHLCVWESDSHAARFKTPRSRT